MRKEDKLILEALKWLLDNHQNKILFNVDKAEELSKEIEKALNPKSQEMPFKDTLKEKLVVATKENQNPTTKEEKF